MTCVVEDTSHQFQAERSVECQGDVVVMNLLTKILSPGYTPIIVTFHTVTTTEYISNK